MNETKLSMATEIALVLVLLAAAMVVPVAVGALVAHYGTLWVGVCVGGLLAIVGMLAYTIIKGDEQ